MGYSAMDIITTLFRVVKTFPDKDMPEFLKLEFIRVSQQRHTCPACMQPNMRPVVQHAWRQARTEQRALCEERV
jgi:hypothetical protein